MHRLALAVLTAALVSPGGPPVQAAPPPPSPQVQEARTSPPPEPVFVRLTLYPTASLSRFDYDIDLDSYELRAYVELRRESPLGEPIPDALVAVQGEGLNWDKDHYEKRITVSKNDLPEEIEVRVIAGEGGVDLRRTFTLPAWLILLQPRPSLVQPEDPLTVGWYFTHFAAPVDLRVYDFKTGRAIFNQDGLVGTETQLPPDALPPGIVVRIYVIQSWVSKRYLTGPGIARGSEINVIPWTQVFVRTGPAGRS